eukprot:7752761-Ditylum_brightwellii.AAC.1
MTTTTDAIKVPKTPPTASLLQNKHPNRVHNYLTSLLNDLTGKVAGSLDIHTTRLSISTVNKAHKHFKKSASAVLNLQLTDLSENDPTMAHLSAKEKLYSKAPPQST